jgi:anti-sigma B factor antagonist
MADTLPFDLQVRPGHVSGSTVISTSGPLVMDNLFRFQDAWRADQSAILIFDLAGVVYIDSSAIGSLVNALVHLSKNGRQMALAAVPDRVQKVLNISKVDRLFQSYASVDEAEGALVANHPA